LTFRFAVAGDFPHVVELASQLASQIEARAPLLSFAQFERNFVGPSAPMRLLLAVRAGRVLGMISWTITHELYSAETRVYISDVSVDRATRGKGIGTALMAEVERWACAHNASKLGWEVWHRNFKARTFYERLGACIDEEAIPYFLTIENSRGKLR
jgi:ribosomal protein S18 acetylase RimI-like enzyme